MMYKLATSSKFNLIQISATAEVEQNGLQCRWDALFSLTPASPPPLLRQEALEEFFSFSSLTSQWLENPRACNNLKQKRNKGLDTTMLQCLSKNIKEMSIALVFKHSLDSCSFAIIALPKGKFFYVSASQV